MPAHANRFSVVFQSDLIGEADHAVIENAIVDTRTWCVFVGDSVILPDVAHQTSFAIGRPYTNMYHFERGEPLDISLRGLLTEDLDSGVLIGGNNNYYHFNIDYLAGLFSSTRSEELGSRVPILTDTRLGWQRETLSCLGFRNNCLPNTHLPKLLKVARLYILRRSFDLWGDNLEKTYYSRVRQRIQHLPELRSDYRYVYLSRQKSPCRRVKNIESLTAFLQRRGFRDVIPDDISVSDQIRIFRSAEVVVAPHGAGLTNIVYARPGLKIIELMPSGSWRPKCFGLIASANGQMLEQSLGSGSFGDLDFSVDLKDVSNKLDQLID